MRKALLLFLGLSICVLPAIVHAQMSSDLPPAKMGLWEMTTRTPGSADAPSVKKSCYTPESYRQAMSMVNAMAKQAGCTITKDERTSHQWNIDATCNISGLAMSSHSVATFKDDEHMSDSSVITMVNKGKTTRDETVVDSHFVSANCGDVKPPSFK